VKRLFLDFEMLREMYTKALFGERATRKVGYAFDVYNNKLDLFIATDQDTNLPATDVNGNLAINVKSYTSRQRTRQVSQDHEE